MRMRTWIVVGALAGASPWLASHLPAEAGDPVEADAATSWRLDVRVVRVNVQAKTVEAAPVVPSTDPTGVTSAPWAELLTMLQQRGTTQIMMDRSVTASPGEEVGVTQAQVESVSQLRRSDSTGLAMHETGPRKTGVDASVTVGGPVAPSKVGYRIVVDWVAASGTQDAQGIHNTLWRGSLLAAASGTLVLRHAQQDDLTRGTEIYALISWRR